MTNNMLPGQRGHVANFSNCQFIDGEPSHYFEFALRLRTLPPKPPEEVICYADPARKNISDIIAIVAWAWKTNVPIDVFFEGGEKNRRVASVAFAATK